MTKILEFLEMFRTKSYAYFSTNIMFLSFIVINLLNGIILRFMTVNDIFLFKPIIGDIAVLLVIGAFAYLIKPKKQYRYFVFWTVLLTAICIINSAYYTFYMSFASVSLLSTSVFVVDVGDAVVEQVVEYKDFIYLYAPVLLYLIHRFLNKKTYYEFVSKVEKGKKMTLMNLLASGILIALFVLSLTSLEVGRLYKQWNREYIVTKFGIYTYQANDIIQSLEPQISGIFGYDNAAKTFRDYYKDKEESPDNKYTGIFEGKNVIVIHAESVQQIAMDLKFNGQEVTPVLNKLAREGMFFDNFYSQVSVGTSSDAEFTFNTSLLPVSSGTVFISYADRTYESMIGLLKEQKNYYVYSMHANNAGFWNRNIMHANLGYDNFYSKKDYELDDIIGLGLSDESFYRQSVEKMKTVKENLGEDQPFYSFLISLTNHTPWSELDKYGDFPLTKDVYIDNELQTVPYMENTTFGRWLKSTRYSDEALGHFIDGLDEAGLLENTVVVIYGDHDARINRRDYNRLVNYDPLTNGVYKEDSENYVPYDSYDYELDRSVPFIIWTKDQKFNVHVDKVMGMYDVFPTLGNMLGIDSTYGLGHDIFSVEDNIVVFPNGNWLTDYVYYNNQKEEYKTLSDVVISEDYIAEKSAYVNNVLDVSNALIKFDLIKKNNQYDILGGEE